MASTENPLQQRAWYEGITGYQWLVLVIASLGWIFDVFEGQIFVASMNEAMVDLTPRGTERAVIDWYNKLAFGAFLAGGALGGVAFGTLSDRIGRTRTMIYTILVYSGFTFLTFFAQTWWHMVLLRFLVALGVGGEWAVASAMIAEVFPTRARAWSLAIFHASSVFGTYLAVGTRWAIVESGAADWRWAFAVGAFPALLTVVIRLKLREPDRWIEARDQARRGDPAQKVGLREMRGQLLQRVLLGIALATIGLATFWGIHVFGKDLMREAVGRSLLKETPAIESLPPDSPARQQFAASVERGESLGMFLTTTGGGIGLLLFGPLCERIGRRGAFLLFHIGGFLATWGLMFLIAAPDPVSLYYLLPIFGMLTLGMHAGYAVYFPELFPTRVRGTGAGLCFNGGRVTAALVLVAVGWFGKRYEWDLNEQALIISSLFLVGVALLTIAPETKGRELPE